MWFIFKRLFLGFFLIALAASVLLFSDYYSRKKNRTDNNSPAAQKVFKIAVLQHSSQAVLGDGVKGMLDALADKGFTDGQRIKLSRFNAEGDLPTANTIAKDITDGRFDLILTASTPSLQAVANANKESKTKHVFALVSDPYGAGVGANRTNHLDHPAWLAGFGTMQPVEASFKLARQMRPALKTVGTVWNAAEANSEVNLKVARAACQALGIELLEATVDNSSGVLEAANSVISRGAEALWVPGDNTVLVAIDSMIQAGRRGRIPVFTVIPPHAEKGALFDVGANYYQVGRLAGDLAAEILQGRDPATVAIENIVPEMLVINKVALEGLREKWEIPAELASRADLVVDSSGTHRKAVVAAAPSTNQPLSKKWRLTEFAYLETPNVEEAHRGLLAGFKDAGLVAGRDYELKTQNAQGDMSTLNSIVDAALTDVTDLLLPSTTPALQVSLKRAGKTPVVFTLVANPILAGAGTSEQDHLPTVTGSFLVSPFEEMLVALKKCLPRAQKIGTLFVPSEVNSVYYKDRLTKAARESGLELVTIGVSASGDVPDAAIALCGQGIDAICQISDNLTGSTFASIALAAKRAKMPLFGFNSAQCQLGAVLCVARDYFDNGREAGLMAARVMRGADPARMPFQQTGATKIFINLQAAELSGVTVPEEVLKTADRIFDRNGKLLAPK